MRANSVENESGDRATKMKRKKNSLCEFQADLTTTLINARKIPPTNFIDIQRTRGVATHRCELRVREFLHKVVAYK